MKSEKIATPPNEERLRLRAKTQLHPEHFVIGFAYCFVVAIGMVAWFAT